MKLRLLLFSLFAVTCLFGQQIEWQGSLSAAAQFAGEDQVPFWMQTNNHFRFGPETNFSGLANFNAKHSLSETSNLEFGATFYYRDGVEDEFQRRDLYLQFENRWLRARVGAKANEEVAQGLSVSNKNFLMSGNARPLAGVLLEANDPLKITETFSFDWGIGHYEMNDNRYVEDVKLHHKWLTLITQFNENHKLTAQLQHYVQWGGTSPVFGDLPSDFSAFIKVFFATNSTEVGIEDEIANAVGNHLGAYLLDYEFKTQLGEFSIYHEHPFEDGSGMRLSNLPDGIWGVHFQPKNKKLIKGALYEYITTNDQSVTTPNGEDNYFSNGVYRSGWSYERRILGMPLISINPNLEITPINSPIFSNRVKAHHFGLTGTVQKIDWKLKSSVVQQLGTYNNPFPEALNYWYNYISLEYDFDNFGNIRVYGAFDNGDNIDSNFGGGLEYSFSF